MPIKKKNKNDRFRGYYPSRVFSPNEDITRTNMKQYDREQAESYAIIDERYGPSWYSLPAAERMKLKDEIRKEAKQRCL